MTNEPRRPSGPPPFGFARSKSGVLEPHPHEAPIRRLAIELFVEHKRLRTVARLLSEAGHRTRSGAKFTDTVVRRLVADPAPGVVPPELWERCREVLVRREDAAPARRGVHLFVGFSFCACGMKLEVPSSTPLAYVCPECRLKVPADILEEAFRMQLTEFKISDDEARDVLDVSPERRRELEYLVESSEARLVIVQADLARAVAGPSVGRRVGEFQEQEAALRRSIERSRSELAHLDDPGEIPAGVGDLYARWPELGGEGKRRIVEALLVRIVVSEGTIRMQLVELPPSPQEIDAPSQPVAPVQQVAPEAEPETEIPIRTHVKVKVAGSRTRSKETPPRAAPFSRAKAPPTREKSADDPVRASAPEQLPGDRLLTEAHVRELIPVSAMTIWRWVKAGTFPKPLRQNGRKYWKAKAVYAWMAAKAAEGGA